MPEDTIFPLVERETPLMDKIRGNDSNAKLPQELGALTANTVLDGEVEISSREFVTSFANSIADELGVEVDDLSQNYLTSVEDAVLGKDLEDILSEEKLSELAGEDEEEEEEESEQEGTEF